MPTYIENVTISIQDRQALIQSFPCFTILSAAQSAELAKLLRELRYSPGEVVVAQDEIVDAVYFIVHGQAEVTDHTEYKKKKTVVPIAILGPGESIGLKDTGFFSATGKRTATVTATVDFLLLRLDLKALYAFLQKNNLESEMYRAAGQMLRMGLIKECLPFSTLSHERLQWLCSTVEDLKLSTGTVLFNQGDRGDKCYLISSGKMEIIATEKDGSAHQLAILKSPTIFGEATLITQEPRNALARAVEDTHLLVLSYEHLTELWEKEQKVAETFMTLMVERSRPSRNVNVREYPRYTPDGQTVVILKNPDYGSYFKLSQEGWYIWQQMNGQQTLLEITMALAKQYQVFSPNMITALISKLAQANFVQNVSLKIPRHEKDSGKVRRWLSQLQKILECRIIFKKVDWWLTKTYEQGVCWLFTRGGQIALAVFTLLGFVVFLKVENHIVNLLRILHASWLLFVFMVPLTVLTSILHELGHAFATKAYGREVHSMGIGWNWIYPVAFTDTTDMWLDTRWHRLVVNVAGLYANFFVAGLCSLCILIMPSHYMQAFLWLFALTTYIKGFTMLNPSQDVDGYFILMDIFEQPHLRHKAMAWLIKKLPLSCRKPTLFLRHGAEVAYWLACLIFLALTAIITLYVQGFILKLLGMQPPNIFSALLLPAFAVVLSSLTLVTDIRQQD
jgi:CRP-like cAMP-binding protein